MPKFKVQHSYRTTQPGRTFAFDEGAEVDVSEEDAEWVNRDSPGTLKPAASKPAKASKPSDSPDKVACSVCGEEFSPRGIGAHEASHANDDQDGDD